LAFDCAPVCRVKRNYRRYRVATPLRPEPSGVIIGRARRHPTLDPMPRIPRINPAAHSATTRAFVQWIRSAAPYIHAFRGKTFVIAFG